MLQQLRNLLGYILYKNNKENYIVENNNYTYIIKTTFDNNYLLIVKDKNNHFINRKYFYSSKRTILPRWILIE